MTAENIYKMIKEMDNAERYKLLGLMYDEYYNKSDTKIADLEYDDE